MKENNGIRRGAIAFFVILTLMMALAWAAQPVLPDYPTLDPADIPKYVNILAGPPPVFVPKTVTDGGEYYEITVTQTKQQILPKPLPMTTVWGYGGKVADTTTGEEMKGTYVRASPSATFEATRNISIQVQWRNAIANQMFAVDPTLHWSDPNGLGMLYCNGTELDFLSDGTAIDCTQPFPPGYSYAQRPVPLVTHLHGAEVRSTSDGHPDAWWTVNGIHGPAYNTEERTSPNAAVFVYPNEQPGTTLWYHDHALGITRINVLSGLAGFYLLRDLDNDPTERALNESGLVRSRYEIPLVFQDRSFNTDGSYFFYTEGNSPSDHPYWVPEFFGNTIMVNGLVWPRLNVDQGVYRFRLLDGSNARFYTLKFCVNEAVTAGGCAPADVDFWQIGTDGGYLTEPVDLGNELTIAPGERADVLVNFSRLSEGQEVYLRNFANAPFPDGDPVDEFTSSVMKFVGTGAAGTAFPDVPDCMNPTLCDGDTPLAFPTLGEPDNTRILVLKEVMNESADEPVMVTLNGQKWSADISEQPVLGSTEEWIIVNPTADAHPIHLHLVQFQLVNRTILDTDAYNDTWVVRQRGNLMDLGYSEEEVEMMPPWPNNYTVEEVDPFDGFGPYTVLGTPDNEKGWKDTLQMYPGQVTTIRVRFSPIDGSDDYSFDATEGPGYVWHCHILDHEDNEMMRPYMVVEPSV